MLNTFFDGLVFGVDDDLRVEWFLERMVDSSKLLNIAVTCLLVESLRITFFSTLNRTFYIDEDEV